MGSGEIITKKIIFMSKSICNSIAIKQKILNWTPTYSIKDGVKMTTDWYHKVYKEKQKPEIVSKIQITKYMNDSKIN